MVDDKKKRNAHKYSFFVSLGVKLQIKFVWLFACIEFSAARLSCSADRVAGGSTKSTLI